MQWSIVFLDSVQLFWRYKVEKELALKRIGTEFRKKEKISSQVGVEKNIKKFNDFSVLSMNNDGMILVQMYLIVEIYGHRCMGRILPLH